MKKLLLLAIIIFLILPITSVEARGFTRGLVIGGIVGGIAGHYCCGPHYYYAPPPTVVYMPPQIYYSPAPPALPIMVRPELDRINDLYARGIISYEEYITQRRAILERP